MSIEVAVDALCCVWGERSQQWSPSVTVPTTYGPTPPTSVQQSINQFLSS